jgi:5-formyltetrahydrofolate cyclo-ligase
MTPARRAPRHDRDAGGPAEVLAAKAALRHEVWSTMRAARVARFPGAEGRMAELSPVDLVVMGCVAAAEDGARLGKGGGFADLEFALASAAGLIGPHTTRVTTVHELQVLPAGTIPLTDHDVLVDFIVTPERVIDCRPRHGTRPPAGIRWEDLTEEKIAAIPLLAAIRRS